MNKKIGFIAMIMAAVMLLAVGCSASKSQMSYTEDSYAMPAAAAMKEAAYEDAAYDYDYVMEEPMAEPEMAAAGVYDEGGAATQAPNYGKQKIIARYFIGMRTDEFEKHTEMLKSEALSLGGYIENSSVNGKKPQTYNDPGRSASFIFRIPTEKVSGFLAFTEGTGEITYNNCETENVTLNYYDKETRLEVLRTQLDRLEAIMVETDNLADIIELEKAIAEVTLEIEQNTTDLRRYDDLINYTSVSIDISENRLAVGPTGTKTLGQRISDGFAEGMTSAGVFLEDTIVGVIGFLPVLVIIAVIIAIIVLIVRLIGKCFKKSRAKRAERAKQRKERMEAVAKDSGERKE